MVERAIPRFPGPKFYWHQWADVTAVGLTDIGGGPLATTLFDYYLTEIDVYRPTTSNNVEEFQIGFQPTVQPITVLQVFFGGQVSPNTGLYFPWRGLLQWIPTQSLSLRNLTGEWSVYASGFFTSSNASQP